MISDTIPFDPSVQSFSISYNEVQAVSMLLVDTLRQQHIPIGEGVAAMAMALGKLLCPLDNLDAKAEAVFIQDFLDYIRMYWAKEQA